MANEIQSAEEFAKEYSPGIWPVALDALRARDKAIVEAACKAVCQWCADGEMSNARAHRAQRINKDYRHAVTWENGEESTIECVASPIRLALRSLVEESTK